MVRCPAAAALSLRELGAGAGMPNRDDVLALVRKRRSWRRSAGPKVQGSKQYTR